ncbi:MAG: sulfotransferase [Planctomycetales bacterium]|nr:sulfotransferase [Planctomycetales bacterium]
MRTPNFFILGAPKSGTTAMYRYLVTHPQIFMSDPKEPAFFATDYPRLKEKLPVPMNSLDDYLALFAKAETEHAIVGEASTAYLSSQAAVPGIVEFNPQSKFLAMLRNPVDFAASFHGQKLVDLAEDEPDFEKAWRLQNERAAGRLIPSTCLEPQLLQYARIGAFGTQIERLLGHAKRDQVKVLLFEDFVRSPADAYRSVLEFLEVPDDGRSDFPLINEAKQHRFKWAYRWLMTPAGRYTRRLLNHHPIARGLKQRILFKPKRRSPLRPAFRQELADVFRPEVKRLETLLQRDLSHWMTSA